MDSNTKAIQNLLARITPQQQYRLLQDLIESGRAHLTLAAPLIHNRRYEELDRLIESLDGDDIDAIVFRATEDDDLETIRYMIETGRSYMYPDLFRTATRTGSWNAYRYFLQNYPDYLPW